MIDYPASLPCVSRIEGHSANISAGLVRVVMDGGNARQRRKHRVLPHTLSLVFIVSQSQLNEWLAWANKNAWDAFFNLKLPGLYAASKGLDTTPTPVRFISDLQTELIPINRLWLWRVTVSAEYVPTPADLIGAMGGWIIAGTPAAPAADLIVAGTPGSPATDWIVGGTPLQPADLV